MGSHAIIRLVGPFDLALSLEAAASFLPPTGTRSPSLRLPVRSTGQPAIVEIRQPSRTPPVIEVALTAPIPRSRLTEMALWLTSGDIDLRGFYRIAASHFAMGPIAKRLRGLKPLRPASLFEMGLIAITEQQLSLAAAFHIRTRLFERFGSPIDDLWITPTPEAIAKASLSDLRACGLSHRKAEYVRDFARRVADDSLPLEALKKATDDEVRDRLLKCRGFGIWSADYFLLRGLGRADALPADDIGLRRTIGSYLTRWHRPSSQQLERALSPFRPFRGLAAYYLAVDARLKLRAARQKKLSAM